ncbi:3-isopropylmalate dehydratase large subunit [Ferroplasma acidiphilum]|jgi:3-isopropylmalate/(R)-2-methylmalate dehydratase large subunit|uniref:3-isopropylmalate dehydratase large subunit n=1 Tax=Ferroplasma acidiphilum TaxID=74969 RepID=A0A1V0N649_9ARCH|nr:3-isopropylmalate dehydratase large subunit [Ferroplasma acidiphilum]ARD85628.1 3-isopropylmalate dehydratase large subunit [Ferroplasma acidiphilum]
MNIVEKILFNHSAEPVNNISPGDIVTVNVDRTIIVDMAALHPEFIENPPVKPFNPEKISLVFDHYVPAPGIEIANRVNRLRKLVNRWGIRDFYDVGRGGISHVLGGEKGWFRPGSLIANTDSHTIATGAFNTLGRGLGTPEIMNIIATGKTWFLLGETLKVNLENSMRPGTSAKDVFFYMSSVIGDVPNKNIEFSGNGIYSLNIDQRSSISTMCAEVSAEFAVFPEDKVLRQYMVERGYGNYRPAAPDRDAEYANEINIDMEKIEPMVALPDRIINNVKPISEIGKVEIDVAVVGSCANGRLSDLRDVAEAVKNKKINDNVRFIVTPASKEIYEEALRLGYIDTIIKSNAMVTNPTCGACLGGHMGVVGNGDTVLSSTTRNFKGRMGAGGARIYLASARSVAISAINGYISGGFNE